MNTDNRIRVYFTADLYGQTVGLQADFGEWAPGKKIPYDELVRKIDVKKLASFLPADSIDSDSIKIITSEEYDRDYGDGKDGSDETD